MNKTSFSPRRLHRLVTNPTHTHTHTHTHTLTHSLTHTHTHMHARMHECYSIYTPHIWRILLVHLIYTHEFTETLRSSGPYWVTFFRLAWTHEKNGIYFSSCCFTVSLNNFFQTHVKKEDTILVTLDLQQDFQGSLSLSLSLSLLSILPFLEAVLCLNCSNIHLCEVCGSPLSIHGFHRHDMCHTGSKMKAFGQISRCCRHTSSCQGEFNGCVYSLIHIVSKNEKNKISEHQ